MTAWRKPPRAVSAKLIVLSVRGFTADKATCRRWIALLCQNRQIMFRFIVFVLICALQCFGQINLSELYEKTQQSVVRVETETGHGSGFLVDEKGWIVTNHHVVRLGRGICKYISVILQDSTRVGAMLLAHDPRNDLAVLQIHPKFVQNIAPLELSRKDPKPGQFVAAFGSPLSLDAQVTRGIISAVQEKTITGDYLIQPGNSGGPTVLENDGSVIGVSTFGVGRTSGSVRASFAENLIATIQRPLSANPIPLRRFTVPGNFPQDKLVRLVKDAFENRKQRRKARQYSENASMKGSFFEWYSTDRFHVSIITPVTAMYYAVEDELLQIEKRRKRRGKKIDDPTYSEDIAMWDWFNAVKENDKILSNSILIYVTPKIGLTTASKIVNAVAAGASIAGSIAVSQGNYGWGSIGWAVGDTMQSLPEGYEFKGEFDRLFVSRDMEGAEKLQPVYVGKRLTEGLLHSPTAKFIDEAYAGLYWFDHSDFMQGDEFYIHLYDARTPEGKRHGRKKIESGSEVVKQIRKAFQ